MVAIVASTGRLVNDDSDDASVYSVSRREEGWWRCFLGCILLLELMIRGMLLSSTTRVGSFRNCTCLIASIG